ncbi:MAG: sigma-70 family RNA polymerase sigma factor [Bacteroidaceae bacterium]|nr:sigma-70 family RNA polymerase sigma factor [Bacteroidaceae bacterium]
MTTSHDNKLRLTYEEERQLGERIAQGDQQALEKLVTANLGFVVSVARQYQDNGLSLDDLVSEGNLALMLAAGKWKPEKGIRFVQYAVWDIRKAIERAIEQQGNIIHDAPASVGFTNSRVDMAVAKSNRNADENIAFLSADSELAGSLGCLNERERKVIILYYGLGTDALTMMEIANEMGLKRERVRQIRKKAERKLRKPLTMLNNEKK